MGMAALAKFMKKAGKKFGDKAGEGGKMALGAASLGAKKAGKFVDKNPRKSAGIAAALGAGAGMDLHAKAEKEKKKKKRPYYTED